MRTMTTDIVNRVYFTRRNYAFFSHYFPFETWRLCSRTTKPSIIKSNWKCSDFGGKSAEWI